jgi:hypothetical protein
MRDPRFDDAQMALVGGCTAGLPSTLRAVLRAAAAAPPGGTLEVTRLDKARAPLRIAPASGSGPASAPTPAIDFAVPPLEAGAYAARLRLGTGTAARYDFACEAGGDEWADSRPDPERLEALARASGGSFATAADAATLPLPSPTIVSAERHVSPLAPP